MILKGTKTFNFAVSEYSKYVDKFRLPRFMLADFLWNCHRQMLHTRNTNIEGVGGSQERERSYIRFNNSVERYFKMVSFIVTRKSYEIYICFVQRPWPSDVYIFKKNREHKNTDLESKNCLWYSLHYGLHLLSCTFTVSVDEPETVSYHSIRWPTLISLSTVCSFWLENLTARSLERFTLCRQVLNC